MTTKSDKPQLQPLPPHRFATIFPPMTAEEFHNLVADIKVNGLRTRIVTIIDDEDGETKVLEGVHRQKGSIEAGVEPIYEPFQGDDPLAYVISANLHRRHLNTGQRAMIAADLETRKHGGDRKSDQDAKLHDRKTAAAALSVSKRSVADASAVRKHGAPELVEAVKTGAVPVSIAADVAERLSVEEQRKAVKDLPRDAKGKVTPAAKKALKATTKAMPKKMVKPKPSGKAKADLPDFRKAVDSLVNYADNLSVFFIPEWLAVVEDKRMPPTERERLIGSLLSVVQQAKALLNRLEPKRPPGPVDRAIQTSRKRAAAQQDKPEPTGTIS